MNPDKFKESLFDDITKEVSDIEALRKDASRAIPRFLTDLDSRKKPKPLITMGQIHIDVHKVIDENPLVCIVFPRGHGKTENFAIGRSLVEIGLDPDIRMKMISESLTLASRRLVSVREHIDKNKRYRKIYPNIKASKTDWGSESFTIDRDTFSKDKTMAAYGAYSAITGDRADLICCDDICGETSIGSKADREKVKRIFWNSIMNLLTVNGRLIYIATPWHFDDLTMNIIKNSPENGFVVYFTAIDKEINPVWGEKWTKEALIKKRASFYAAGEMGAWSRGYHCEPQAAEDATFNRGDIENSIKVRKECNPYKDAKVNNEDWIILITVDPAISKTSKADFTVIFVGAVHIKKRIRVPLEIVRKKMSSPETAREIIRVANYWNPMEIGIEKAGYQGALAQWTEELSDTPLPIIEIYNKLNKDERINNLAVSFASKAWKVYMHQNPLDKDAQACTCGFCFFIEECVNHPAARHDDTPDAAEMFDKRAIEKTKISELVFDLY